MSTASEPTPPGGLLLPKTARRALKRWVAHALGLWFGSRLLVGAGTQLGAPKRILVLRVDERVGNVLLTTPLIRALKEHFPEARIECLVAANKAPILRGLVEPIPFEKRDFFVHPIAFWRLLFRLRGAAYDLVIDASHWHHFSATSALLLAWTRAPRRVAHDRGVAQLYATHSVPPPSASEPEVLTKLRLLTPLGIEPRLRALETRLGTSSESVATTDVWIESQSLRGKKLVGLAPGSRKPDHRVDPEVFAALARFAQQRGAAGIVLWGPGEQDLARKVADGGGAVLAPPTDLEHLAALLRRCAVVVTNDTGPMHLSVACGAPTIAMFKAADPVRWGHGLPPNVVIAADGRANEELLTLVRSAMDAILSAPPPSPG